MNVNACRFRRGFTLIEVVLAMVISGFLIAAIMIKSKATVSSTRVMVERQNAQIVQDAFFTLMKDHFEGLPGNCRLELTFSDSGQQYLSDMTFQNVPAAFNWGGVAISAEAMRMSTLPLRDGSLDIILEYYDEPILDSDESLAERGIEPIASITLLQNVHLCEWRVLDGRSSEWDYEWDIPGRRPTQVELSIMFDPSGDLIRRVFWIPSKANPTTEMRRLQGAAQNQQQRLNQQNPATRIPQGGGNRGGGTPNTGGGRPQIR
ncbi:MAG: type II secretion system protein [Akkermansiaceae bacterium]